MARRKNIEFAEPKPITGTDGKYSVDAFGNFYRNCKSGMKPLRTYKKDNLFIIGLTLNGKRKYYVASNLVWRTFRGEIPQNKVVYHINGVKSDNRVNNLELITRRELGKRTGASSNRRPVAKYNKNGEAVEFYSSARAAARKNYMSYQTIMDRCNGKVKGKFAPDGFEYRWDDLD